MKDGEFYLVLRRIRRIFAWNTLLIVLCVRRRHFAELASGEVLIHILCLLRTKSRTTGQVRWDGGRQHRFSLLRSVSAESRHFPFTDNSLDAQWYISADLVGGRGRPRNDGGCVLIIPESPVRQVQDCGGMHAELALIAARISFLHSANSLHSLRALRKSENVCFRKLG